MAYWTAVEWKLVMGQGAFGAPYLPLVGTCLYPSPMQPSACH